MPQQAWSAKRERQYKHIKEGLEERGESEDKAEEIAARTVNKERAQAGEAKDVEPVVDERHLVQPAGRPPVAQGSRRPDQGPALQRGQEEEHRRPVEDDQGRVGEGRRPLIRRGGGRRPASYSMAAYR